MRRLLMITALTCFAVSGSLSVYSALAESVNPVQSPATSPEIQHKQVDKAKEVACGCCQKCMAAKKPVKPDQEKVAPKTGGCQDCCSRCGKVKLPPHENMPPEIIKKQ